MHCSHFILRLLQAVRESGSSWLVDDSQDIQPRYLARVFSGLAGERETSREGGKRGEGEWCEREVGERGEGGVMRCTGVFSHSPVSVSH